MSELYSIKEVGRIFDVPPSRLRYWIQTGFIGASVKKGGRLYYRFEDLIAIKTALELLDAGQTVQKVRKQLDALRAILADDPQPLSKLRICSDGDNMIAMEAGIAFEPTSGQLVMSFAVDSLRSRVAEILELPRRADAPAIEAVPDAPDATPPAVPDAVIDDGPTDAHAPPSAYGLFLQGVDADERGDEEVAERCYQGALDLEPSLAAAHTNLGNILYRRGDSDGARRAFERALEYEPEQPEARYNLGNLLEDLGDTEHAIAELRRVCRTHPDFADAHYNLGLLLARVGGVAQARSHLEQYLAMDASSEWASRGRQFLANL